MDFDDDNDIDDDDNGDNSTLFYTDRMLTTEIKKKKKEWIGHCFTPHPIPLACKKLLRPKEMFYCFLFALCIYSISHEHVPWGLTSSN